MSILSYLRNVFFHWAKFRLMYLKIFNFGELLPVILYHVTVVKEQRHGLHILKCQPKFFEFLVCKPYAPSWHQGTGKGESKSMLTLSILVPLRFVIISGVFLSS